jgi:hypothetical protein
LGADGSSHLYRYVLSWSARPHRPHQVGPVAGLTTGQVGAVRSAALVGGSPAREDVRSSAEASTGDAMDTAPGACGIPEVCRSGDLGERGDRVVRVIVRRVVESALPVLRTGSRLAVVSRPVLGVEECRVARLAPRGCPAAPSQPPACGWTGLIVPCSPRSSGCYPGHCGRIAWSTPSTILRWHQRLMARNRLSASRRSAVGQRRNRRAD